VQLTDALPSDVSDHLTELVDYLWAMWIDSQMWLPCAWSAYWLSVHTNNDVIIIAVVYSLHTPFQHIFGGHKNNAFQRAKWEMYTYLLRLSSSCPGRDIGQRDFSTGVDRWQLSLHHAKLSSFCEGLS